MADNLIDEAMSGNAKKQWCEPLFVDLEFGSTGTKLNRNASEFSRSGISYNPS